MLQPRRRAGCVRCPAFEAAQRSRRPGGLPHGETGTAGAGGRLAQVFHRRAPTRHEQVLHPFRLEHAQREVVVGIVRIVREGPRHRALHVLLHRPRVQSDDIVEARALQDIVAGESIGPTDPARLTHAHLRRQVEQLGALESRDLGAQETQVVDRLAPPVELGLAELAHIEGIGRTPARIAQLGHVGTPAGRISLRPQDRPASREAMA